MRNFEHKLFFDELSVKIKPYTWEINKRLNLPIVLLKAKAEAELQWQII